MAAKKKAREVEATQEQRDEFAARWRGYALCSDPADRAATKAQLDAMYALIELPPAPVVWGDSPPAIVMAGSLLQSAFGVEIAGRGGDPLPATEATQALRRRVKTGKGDLNTLARAATVELLAGDPLGEAFTEGVVKLLVEAIVALGKTPPGEPIKPRITPLWRDAPEGAVDESLLAAVEWIPGAMGLDVSGRSGISAASAHLRALMLRAIQPAKDSKNPGLMGVAERAFAYQWTGGCEAGHFASAQWARYEWLEERAMMDGVPVVWPVVQLCKVAGYTLSFDNITLAAERATIHMDSQNRLSRDGGPALCWPDGVAVYAVSNIVVDEQVIMRPETITAQQVLAQRNAEIARIMVDRMGQDKFLAQLDAKEILPPDDYDPASDPLDAWNTAKWGRLFEAESLNSTIRFLRVVNGTPEPDGTFREFTLVVATTCRTPLAAVAFTYDMTDEEYSTGLIART